MAKLPENIHAQSLGVKPFKFKTVEALQAALDKYFADPNEVPWTISGLAFYLGSNRCVLLDYQGRNGYGTLIRAAKDQIEASIEKRLVKPDGAPPAGIIFNLCNNWSRWHQRQETTSTVTANVNSDVKVSGLQINWVGSDSTHL
jgi:hypothetical protein